MANVTQHIRVLVIKARRFLQKVVLGIQAITSRILYWLKEMAKALVEFVWQDQQAFALRLDNALKQIDKALAKEAPIEMASDAQIRYIAKELGLDPGRDIAIVRNDILCAVAV